jgi:hypothetical protein
MSSLNTGGQSLSQASQWATYWMKNMSTDIANNDKEDFSEDQPGIEVGFGDTTVSSPGGIDDAEDSGGGGLDYSA